MYERTCDSVTQLVYEQHVMRQGVKCCTNEDPAPCVSDVILFGGDFSNAINMNVSDSLQTSERQRQSSDHSERQLYTYDSIC